MTRPPASASENRTYDAEKIGLSRYFDFFNRIGQKATFTSSSWDNGNKYNMP
jgi:hypothetical protein